MDELTTRSTSRATAKVSDIVLRETSVTRLVFRPIILDNPALPSAAAEGTFVFQRKSPKKSWSDIAVEPLSKLKQGESYKLALDSSETRRLFDSLSALYEIHAGSGVPQGQAKFVRAKGALAALAGMGETDLRTFLAANKAVGAPLIARLLSWAADTEQVQELVGALESLGASTLSQLGAAVNIGALHEILRIWQEHSGNADESFWQATFTQRSFILEQLFAWPCTIVKERAYIGGKTVHNTGGNLVDFLVKNQLTSSAALVEIKTPAAKLTGANYRDGIPNITGELAGSVIQAATYKASLHEHYLGLRTTTAEFTVFDPPCVVIIGSSATLTTTEQRRTFELFRRQLSGVQVVTFDELFMRIERLVALLSPSATPDGVPVEDEPPF